MNFGCCAAELAAPVRPFYKSLERHAVDAVVDGLAPRVKRRHLCRRVRRERIEDTVANGVYLLVWWDVPVSDARVTAFRIGSEWVRAPTMREQFLAQRAEWLRARGS